MNKQQFKTAYRMARVSEYVDLMETEDKEVLIARECLFNKLRTSTPLYIRLYRLKGKKAYEIIMGE